MDELSYIYCMLGLFAIALLLKWMIKLFCTMERHLYYHMRRRTHTRQIPRYVRHADRQGNIFTIANETTNNQLPNRCTDFYYVEPSATDAARIQAQLEKDEKDLPTYEEVMAMSLAEVNGSTLALPPTTTTSSTSVATTDTVVPVPPYSEAERNVLPTVHQPSNSGLTTTTTGSTWAASTSRAAAAAATNTPVVTIANSVSNTSV
ncbi:uncharacterized protein LOC101451491 isoform X5 [Ceratitis capitata]|nr:uncharacterized protein LOC101451491 isoform X5 [Ceratitis capitata]